MASVIHRTEGLSETPNWAGKAEILHFKCASNGARHAWRFIIAKGNRIDGIEAVV